MRDTPSAGTLAPREVDAILEQALRLIRERADVVLNAVDDGIYVLDQQGHTIFANEAAVRMLGYTLREMLGQPQHALVHYAHADGSAFPIEECPIYHSVNEGIYERVGGDVFWRKDGRPMLVDYTSTPIKEGRTIRGAVVTFRDATGEYAMREQKARMERDRVSNEARDRTLAESTASRELLEQAVEHVPAAVSMTRGREHRIVLANARARALAGRPTLVGHTIAEVFPDLAGQRVMELFERVYETGEPVTARGLTVRWDADGTGTPREGTFDVSYIAVRDASGEVTGVLTYASESATR